MQKQQVFKVKGMQRDLSMANTNGEFAYEIVNMRLLPAEENAGLSLTNEKGTLEVPVPPYKGTVIGQCPTNDSLVFFTCDPGGSDYIYELYQEGETWQLDLLFQGDLNFSIDNKIEAIFNYETLDIQKVYWIDKENQLRCINIVESPTHWGMVNTSSDDNPIWGPSNNVNNQYFDSVKEIASLPNVEIERVIGGSFTAGVVQYYVTYFNKNSSESPIVYTSPLLYIAHDNRGANVNDQVSTAFKLTLTNLDTTNWEYMRIYTTHRTSIDATPEASIVTELNMDNSTIEFTDYGGNRTSIAPTDLYFIGGKFVKAGTMTVKDQVMFLGNLNIETPETVSVVEIQQLFDSIRGNEDHPFTTTTRKTKENKLDEYEDTHYYYKNQLNNTESITHYKYGEKYRFGISVLDKYGNWSNPIWIKDAFIEIPPEQVDSSTLALPCPRLNLSYILTYNNETKTLLEHLQDRGAMSIKPLVVFPEENERKVIAQGVVCPTVYNLKDRKENGPYAQASWFMRPNAPVDLWGIDSSLLGRNSVRIATSGDTEFVINQFGHKSQIQSSGNQLAAYYGVARGYYDNNVLYEEETNQYVYDDIILDDEDNYSSIRSRKGLFKKESPGNSWSYLGELTRNQEHQSVVEHGIWVEFRHNYALRAKGSSFGAVTPGQTWNMSEFTNNKNYGFARVAELDTSRSRYTAVINRFNYDNFFQDGTGVEGQYTDLDNVNLDTSAYYVDNSIVTLNSPEIELSDSLYSTPMDGCNFRIIGMIPITGTISDVSLQVENPASDPLVIGSTGLQKIFTQNRNIGKHGFKGLVATNAYYSNYAEGGYYGLVPLYPWNSVGSLGLYTNTDTIGNTKSVLKSKILSNLRFSASSSYFKLNSLIFREDSTQSDRSKISATRQEIIGWTPINSCTVQQYTTSEATQIIKLDNLNYNTTSIVYKGNIDSIANLTANTSLTDILDQGIYTLGEHTTRPAQYLDYLSRFKYSPSVWNKSYSKLAKGASIKYKSAPHFVIGFKCYSPIQGITVQETLPAWRGLNEEGLSQDKYSNSLSYGSLYEDTEVAALYHQDYIHITTANDESWSFGLPEKNASREERVVGNNNDITLENQSTDISKNSLEFCTGFYNLQTNHNQPSLPGEFKFTSQSNGQVNWQFNTSSQSSITITGNGGAQISMDLEISEDPNRLELSQSSIQGEFEIMLEGQGITNLYKDLIMCAESMSIGEERTLSGYTDITTTSRNTSITAMGSRDVTIGTQVTTYRWEWTPKDNNPCAFTVINKGAGNLLVRVILQSCPCEVYAGLDKIDTNEGTIGDKPSYLSVGSFQVQVDLSNNDIQVPNYGWLWLGEIHRETDPMFGGNTSYALASNQWENAGNLIQLNRVIELDLNQIETSQCNGYYAQPGFEEDVSCVLDYDYGDLNITLSGIEDIFSFTIDDADVLSTIACSQFTKGGLSTSVNCRIYSNRSGRNTEVTLDIDITYLSDSSFDLVGYIKDYDNINNSIFPQLFEIYNIPYTIIPIAQSNTQLKWTQGDTYYQRFDTLKTYAYSDSDQNSVVDITSFMVETRVNIDGRYDRNRGQESNLQMSPTNFNLMNDVYSQRDNFFTYRILDDDVQARTKFPNQITWSLSKTAGATVDAWMNITLASVLDLDGAEGELKALKTFNNSIIAFQESGISQVLFNSRVQIPTSEMVPIQIANSGKVDGQQYISRDVGCQDKWNIVTTPMGLYFVDYFNKSIYRFNGQLEDLSSSKGFRGWCDKYINSTSSVIGYYDVKNREVMYYDNNFTTDSLINEDDTFLPAWLGYSELTNNFSSFYTYPEAVLSNIKGDGIWMYGGEMYQHQAGSYNNLLGTKKPYGLTVVTRQDSNMVKTFNNVEFRADTYSGEGTLLSRDTFNTLKIWTENDGETPSTLSYSEYRPSNLKKKLRTWRANIPRVNNGYKRFVNQWAKIGLWKMNPSTEKTILHDLSVWYSE